jgi:hypothetical protein
MAFAAKVLTDSVSELGDRLVTFEVTFPRIVLSEFNTHCGGGHAAPRNRSCRPRPR